MTPDPLSAEKLMAHVRRLSDEIGPRPAGHRQEEAARQVIRQALQAAGLPTPAEQPLVVRRDQVSRVG